jgi:hypothetical protein
LEIFLVVVAVNDKEPAPTCVWTLALHSMKPLLAPRKKSRLANIIHVTHVAGPDQNPVTLRKPVEPAEAQGKSSARKVFSVCNRPAPIAEVPDKPLLIPATNVTAKAVSWKRKNYRSASRRVSTTEPASA